MKKQHKQKLITFVNGFGYLSVLLQWLWAMVIVLPLLLQSGMLDILMEQKSPPEVQAVEQTASSPMPIGVAVAITVVVVILTLYIITRIPRTISQTGQRITEKTSAKIVPIVTHHQPISRAKKRVISLRVQFYVKLVACLIPVIILLFAPAVESISKELIIFLEAYMALWSIILFAIAYKLSLK